MVLYFIRLKKLIFNVISAFILISFTTAWIQIDESEFVNFNDLKVIHFPNANDFFGIYEFHEPLNITFKSTCIINENGIFTRCVIEDYKSKIKFDKRIVKNYFESFVVSKCTKDGSKTINKKVIVTYNLVYE